MRPHMPDRAPFHFAPRAALTLALVAGCGVGHIGDDPLVAVMSGSPGSGGAGSTVTGGGTAGSATTGTGGANMTTTGGAGRTTQGTAGATTTPTQPGVTISPKASTLLTGKSAQFQVTVAGLSGAGVTWKVMETGAGGTITPAGLYTAPTSAGTFHVVVTSTADATKSDTATITVALPSSSTTLVDFTDVHQPIAGFGACDRYDGELSDALMTQFFDADKGIGLTMLRTSFTSTGAPEAGTWSNMQRAQKMGALVWAAPWSPPGQMKDNGSVNGGSLLTADYMSWAMVLAQFVTTAKTNGVTISAVSLQNEPNLATDYDSCVFSPFEYMNFLNVVGPLFAAMTPRPKIIAGEPSAWTALWDYTGEIEKDATAPMYADIYGTHEYGGDDPTVPMSSAKPIWETEVSTFDAYSTDITNGLRVAKLAHDALVIGNAQAWHYWWLVGQNADNEGLMGQNGNAEPTKRLWTVGNFSKFVRPGYERVGTMAAPAGVLLSAYRDTAGKGFAIVAINNNTTATPMTFTFNGLQTTSVVPWVTSATLDLAAQSAITTTTAGFGAALAASSVTTFVGTSK
jgi:glucuronoarabinoxylan endo-1,4-beta-xylanase